jgi:Uma2 family endonuclease
MTLADATELWESLGCVPQHRIVQDPAPGTATEADVVRLDDHEDRLCELIDGTLVEKAMGYEESLIATQIGYLLQSFVRARRLGWVSGEAGMMRILRRRVRIPDVAFVSKARLPEGQRPKGPIPDLVPDLAVEVISESNTTKEMQIKLKEYFAAGTRLVWYVDPPTRTVQVFTSPDTSTRLNESDTITGCDVLPGFEVQVAEFFDID